MNPPKSILVFDLKGPLAHFRKFYTNSSSLTYISPPRTVVTGLIAGILGRERDTFFEEFDANRCGIGVSLRIGIRKIMQTVNYVRTKDNDGYSSFAGIIRHAVNRQITGYPTPLELVLPLKPHRELKYRIYFSHHDEKVFNELQERIIHNQYVYPPYLGLSECLGETSYVASIKEEDISTAHQSDDFLEIATTCSKEMINGLDFEQADKPIHYIEERMPILLGENRTINRKGEFIGSMNGRYIRAKLKSGCLKIAYQDKGLLSEYITFLE